MQHKENDMGVLYEIVEKIQDRINKENHRPWMEVIRETKEEFEEKGILKNENTCTEKR